VEGNERKDMIQCTIPSPHRHGRKEIEEEIRGRREGAHTRQHTDTKGKKKGARERLCSWLVVVARFTNVIRMELHPLTTRKTQQQEEERVFIFLSFLIIILYISLTHSLTKRRRKKLCRLFCSSSSSSYIYLYGGEIEIDRERERLVILCGLRSFPPWIFNLVFLGFQRISSRKKKKKKSV
jgi:hypothetical protein